MAIRYWLGVASREQVHRGVAMGLAQAGDRSRGLLEQMREADGVVYYSPKTEFDGDTLREFTAIGWVGAGAPDGTDVPGAAAGTGLSGVTGLSGGSRSTGQLGAAGSATYRAWRHPVDYDLDAVAASIRPLLSVLDFTRDDPDWGYQLRRGLIEISRHDYDLIRRQMRRG